MKSDSGFIRLGKRGFIRLGKSGFKGLGKEVSEDLELWLVH
jgi:hypothetical protein